MDLDEWELLPVDGFLGIDDDCGEKMKWKGKRRVDPITVFDMDLDYFRCPSPRTRLPPNQLVPVRIQLDPPIKIEPDEELPKEKTRPALEVDQETVMSQVFFKKLKDTEFADMKILDSSPRSGSRAVSPPIESFRLFEDKADEILDVSCCSPRKMLEGDSMDHSDMEDEESWKENRGALSNILKWGFTGIGALCTFGMAAATVCILIVGNHQRSMKQNQRLTFEIYSDDKRIKQVVHHATKLNEAISAARGAGVPLTRAHITIGGYHEGL